jgi:hypothetical protein
MIRKIRRFFDPMTIWCACCAVAGVALIVNPHLLIR